MTVLRLDRTKAAVLVVDVQERLCAAMEPTALARMVRRTCALLEGARALGLPVAYTEQYPRGLGPTLAALKPLLEGATFAEKLRFSAAVPAIEKALAGRTQLLLAGMETHVCVFQTARDFVANGSAVLLVTDAVLSRTEEDRRVGLELCRHAGAQLWTVEAALFDLLAEAGTPEFKRVSAAVK